MKVLILGGTGAMGKYLTQLLNNKQNKIYVTTRKERKSSGAIYYICGDAHDTDFLSSILQNKWDVIVDFMSYSTKEFAERTDLLLDSTLQYVFLSSSRVYSEVNGRITEETPRLLESSSDQEYLKTDEYALAKARQENLLKESLKRNWTIIRPYITYSENRLQLGVLEKEYWLYRALHNRTIIFSKEIAEKTTTLTYGLDVAYGIKSIMANKNTLGEIFHIASQDKITWQEVYNIYNDVLQQKLGIFPRIIYCDLKDFGFCHFAKYQIMYDRLYNRIFNSEKISHFINISDFISPEEGLRKCLTEFLEDPVFNEIDWSMEARKDRISREYTPLKEIPYVKQKVRYLLYRFLI